MLLRSKIKNENVDCFYFIDIPFIKYSEDALYAIKYTDKYCKFKGGSIIKFIADNIKLPDYESSQKEVIVSVTMIVDKNGKISDIEALGDHPDIFLREAERVISLMQEWEPAIMENKPVDVKQNIKVTFNYK